MSYDSLVGPALMGNRRQIGKLISIVESDARLALKVMEAITHKIGRARLIGITGPPGAGKSSLTAEVTRSLRKRGFKVAALVVDPSSHLTGGAVLGDRIRMNSLTCDEGVFIRSMATRGCLGGISSATNYAANILDACGYDYIIIETVGVGQSEIDIAKIAHAVLVVFVPGLGDDIQAMKSGITEIADIFVINKSDLSGSEKVFSDLKAMNDLNKKSIPICSTISETGSGIENLLTEINEILNDSKKINNKEKIRIEKEYYEILRLMIDDYLNKSDLINKNISNNVEKIINKKSNIYLVAKDTLGKILLNLSFNN